MWTKNIHFKRIILDSSLNLSDLVGLIVNNRHLKKSKELASPWHVCQLKQSKKRPKRGTLTCWHLPKAPSYLYFSSFLLPFTRFLSLILIETCRNHPTWFGSSSRTRRTTSRGSAISRECSNRAPRHATWRASAPTSLLSGQASPVTNMPGPEATRAPPINSGLAGPSTGAMTSRKYPVMTQNPGSPQVSNIYFRWTSENNLKNQSVSFPKETVFLVGSNVRMYILAKVSVWWNASG